LREQTRAVLCGPVLQQSGLFDGATITRLLDQHATGVRNHSAVIWMLSMFASFLQTVHGATADPVTVAA
jgi:asparagine synthase (glutamine-hydrolysing)